MHLRERRLKQSMLFNRPLARWRADRKPTSLNTNSQDTLQYAHPINSFCIQTSPVDFIDADFDDFWYIILTSSSSRVVHEGDTEEQILTFANVIVVVESWRGSGNGERATEGCCKKGGISLG